MTRTQNRYLEYDDELTLRRFPYEGLASYSPSILWSLYLQGDDGPVGYMPSWVVDKMPLNREHWKIDEEKKTLTTKPKPQSKVDNSWIFNATLETARANDIFEVLKGWRNELYPIYGHQPQNRIGVSIERSGSPLFGIHTYGVHMTAYVNTQEGLKIWVPRRSRSKQTYGGFLDNSVAGGLATGEQPFDCLVRESSEEASLEEAVVRRYARPCGTVSYFHVRDEKAGGEGGLMQPECQYVYDLELPEAIQPRPNDTEVECFYLWSVDEVASALANGEFKPNCAVVLLDFFIRHGLLTAENEPNYVEIVSRLHRKLPFPTP